MRKFFAVSILGAAATAFVGSMVYSIGLMSSLVVITIGGGVIFTLIAISWALKELFDA